MTCGDVIDIGAAYTNAESGNRYSELIVASAFVNNSDSGGPLYLQDSPTVLVGSVAARQRQDGILRSLHSSIDFLGDVDGSPQVYTHTDRTRDWVIKMYEVAFSRLPNLDEYEYWRDDVNGSCDFGSVGDMVWSVFHTSGEFEQDRPGNTDFRRRSRIRLLYWGALGRDIQDQELADVLTFYKNNSWPDVVHNVAVSAELDLVADSGHNSYDGAIC